MSQFPYPIQYFSCRDFEAAPEKIQRMLEYLSQLGTGLAGPVAGETGIPGLKIDFNDGIRLQVPAGNWQVTIGDHDSGMVFYDGDASETILISFEKYYVRWQVEIRRDGVLVFSHIFDPAGQKVRLVFNSVLLGDTLSFFPYLPRVREAFGAADVYYSIDRKMQALCQRLFPDIRQRDYAEADTYATYYFNSGIDFPGAMPINGRILPIAHAGQMILNLPSPAPKLPWVPGPRQIKEPYVCLGAQASHVAKGWLWPGGWEAVVAHLKGLGYRVLGIDREKECRAAFKGQNYTVKMPDGAEDFTGNRPLLERADMLHHADFFIGLPSGLSWLAWTADCPVVMIGGFSLFWHEFPTPYRVYNRLACDGCYNSLKDIWQGDGCPRQKPGTEAVLQCSKTITPRMVIAAIDRLLADKRTGREPL